MPLPCTLARSCSRFRAALSLEEISRAFASARSPLRDPPELKLVGHRLAVHSDRQLGIQAGQVLRDPTRPKLPHGLTDCFVHHTCPDLDLMDDAVGIGEGDNAAALVRQCRRTESEVE